MNGTSSFTAPRPRRGNKQQAEIEYLRAKVAKLENDQQLMATRLEEIVGKFQEEFGSALERTTELIPEELQESVSKYMLLDRDEFIESLAEVKQVRTVLSGFLDAQAVIAAIEAAKSEQARPRHEPKQRAVEILSDDEEEPAPPQKVALDGELCGDGELNALEGELGDGEGGAQRGSSEPVKTRATNEKAYQEAVSSLFGTDASEDAAAASASSTSVGLFGDDATREEAISTPSLNPGDALAVAQASASSASSSSSSSSTKKSKKKRKKKSAKEKEKVDSLIKEGFGVEGDSNVPVAIATAKDSPLAVSSESVEDGDLFAAEKPADGDLFATSSANVFSHSQKRMRPRSPHTPPSESSVPVTPTDLFSSPLAVVPAGASTPTRKSTSRPNPAFDALSEVQGLSERKTNSSSDNTSSKQFIASSEKTSNRPMLFKKNATTREYVPEITFESPPETHDLFRAANSDPSPNKRVVESPFEDAKPDLVGEESPL